MGLQCQVQVLLHSGLNLYPQVYVNREEKKNRKNKISKIG